jgi:antitoxin HigA-1
METNKLQAIHPGEVLLEEFLIPLGLTSEQLALGIKVDSQIIKAIIEKKQPITADLALRLSRYFKMSPQFWLGLQLDYDLDVAEDNFGTIINQEVVALIT